MHPPLSRGGRPVADISRSSLFDARWYEAQVGHRFRSRRAAIAHYLDKGFRGFSPHPFFEPSWLAFQGMEVPDGSDPLSAYLGDPEAQATYSTHPLLDLEALKAELPEGHEAPRGPVDAWLRGASEETSLPLNAELPAPVTVGRYVQLALEAVAEHHRDRAVVAEPRAHASLVEALHALPHPRVPSGGLDGSRPLVTVLVTAIRRAPRVRQAVESAQAQTYTNLEIIVVDTGTDEDTAHVVTGIGAFDARVRLVGAEAAGAGEARNRGLAVAKGEYVAFVDDRSAWEPGYLEVMLSAMEHHAWDVAHGIAKVVTPSGAEYQAFEGTREQLLAAGHVHLDSVVVRRDLVDKVGGFAWDSETAAERDFVLRLSAHSTIHAVPVVGPVRTGSSPGRRRGGRTRYWNEVVVGHHLVDWEGARQKARAPGTISVVLPVSGSPANAVRWIASLARVEPGGSPVGGRLEVVVLAAGCDLETYRLVRAVGSLTPGVTVLRTPWNPGWATAVNVAAAHSSGAGLVVVHPCAIPPEGSWLAPLVEAVSQQTCLAQPLVLDRAGLVSTAGAGFAEGQPVPYPLLRGHAMRDAGFQREEVPSLYGPVFAAAADLFLALRGLDPATGGLHAETDLGLRARREFGVPSVVVPACSLMERAEAAFGFPAAVGPGAEHLGRHADPELYDATRSAWSRAGFGVLRHEEAPFPGPADVTRPVPVVRVERAQVVQGPPALRWVIEISAPAGPYGERWGDLHFTRSLARSLEALGQHVAIDFREGRERPTREHDDVLLVMSGLEPPRPLADRVSMQWIISHPGLATAEQSARFDAVFAASISWSQAMTEAWGIPVRPLLQCTDPELFHPSHGAEDTGPPVLFVGNTRHVMRPVVAAALECGVDVDIYGRYWEGFVPSRLLKAESVPNAALGALYAAAGVVLNDHWDDMRDNGFLSNRLFDAVACGARVISDDVQGIGELFGPSVQVFNSTDELCALLDGDPRTRFPGRPERLEAAARMARDHSFQARAQALLDEAIAARSRRAGR